MIEHDIYSREESKYLKIGFSVALGILLTIAFWIINNKRVTHLENGKYYQIIARFNRTDGLLVGDLVRLGGINIGKVVDASLDDNFKAIMTLEVKDSVQIPDDSSASIVSSGMMGTKYIEIEPGGSEDMIIPGGEFSYTQDAMVMEELLDRIVNIGKTNRQNRLNKNKGELKNE